MDYKKFEKSCGMVVFKESAGYLFVLLVHHNMGHWGFPKGHIEENETEVETAIRETKEETGIGVTRFTDFRKAITYSPKEMVIKDVVFFIGKALDEELLPQLKEVSEVNWIEVEDALKLITHEDEKQVLREALICYRENR